MDLLPLPKIEENHGLNKIMAYYQRLQNKAFVLSGKLPAGMDFCSFVFFLQNSWKEYTKCLLLSKSPYATKRFILFILNLLKDGKVMFQSILDGFKTHKNNTLAYSRLIHSFSLMIHPPPRILG